MGLFAPVDPIFEEDLSDVAEKTTAEPVVKPISAEEGTSLLTEWAHSRTETGILYAASHGQATAVLRGTVQLDSELLRIRGSGSVLHVWIGDAEFRHGPVLAFGQGYMKGETSPGLHVTTAHGDWLFLSPRLDPELLAPRLQG